jgi:hypothetical protein
MPKTWIPDSDLGLHVFDHSAHGRGYFAMYLSPCPTTKDGGMVYQATARCPLVAAAMVLRDATDRCECPKCCMEQDARDADTGESFKGLRLVGSRE